MNKAYNKIENLEKDIKELKNLIAENQQKFDFFKNNLNKANDRAIIGKYLTDPPNIFIKINRILTKKKLTIDEFLKKIENTNDIINLTKFFDVINNYGEQIDDKDIKSFFKHIKDNLDKYLSVQTLIFIYELTDFSANRSFSHAESHQKPKDIIELSDPKSVLISENLAKSQINIDQKLVPCVKLEDLKDTLTHINFRLQLHRLSKSDVAKIFASGPKDQNIDFKSLNDLFQRQPFTLDNINNIHMLSRFLLENKQEKFISVDKISQLNKPHFEISQNLLGLFDD